MMMLIPESVMMHVVAECYVGAADDPHQAAADELTAQMGRVFTRQQARAECYRYMFTSAGVLPRALREARLDLGAPLPRMLAPSEGSQICLHCELLNVQKVLTGDKSAENLSRALFAVSAMLETLNRDPLDK